MNLIDLVNRRPVPAAWAEGEKIPWHDPDFSRRMLREHLSQSHDAASRRVDTIEQQVRWIHEHLLGGEAKSILDLACGPGLYALRLARLGHAVTGIDFAPAAVAYARQQADQEGLPCAFVEGDIRTAGYGNGFDLVMLIFGEFNVFRPTDAQRILRRIHAALAGDGLVLLEPHTFAAVRRMGEQPSTWYSAQSGLFADGPHLCLMETFWDGEKSVATERYLIVDAETAGVTRHAASIQAYTEQEYGALLRRCGFSGVTVYPSLTGAVDPSQPDLIAVVGRKTG